MNSFYKSFAQNPVSYVPCPPVCWYGEDSCLLAALASFEALFPSGCDLYLFPENRRSAKPWTLAAVEWWKTFLELQPSVRSVSYSEAPSGRDLNGWRDCAFSQLLNYADQFAEWSGLGYPGREPWLVCDYALNNPRQIVVSRSSRYSYRSSFPWRDLVSSLGLRMVFVGTDAEHGEFERYFGPVHHYQPSSALELARVLSGSSWYLGGQDWVYQMAVGLGVPVWAEMNNSRVDSCRWAGCRYGVDEWPVELRV